MKKLTTEQALNIFWESERDNKQHGLKAHHDKVDFSSPVRSLDELLLYCQTNSFYSIYQE
jgi:hypothetical protein